MRLSYKVASNRSETDDPGRRHARGILCLSLCPGDAGAADLQAGGTYGKPLRLGVNTLSPQVSNFRFPIRVDSELARAGRNATVIAGNGPALGRALKLFGGCDGAAGGSTGGPKEGRYRRL